MNINSYLEKKYLLKFAIYSIILFATSAYAEPWQLIDDFENAKKLNQWILKDTDNSTFPFIPNPQVTKIIKEEKVNNSYLLKKPAPDGIIGNRKALTYRQLPQAIAVGEVATIYTRVNIESFPNNHIFGISNLDENEIAKHGYNSFEPSLRITDKKESNGLKNNGTLMVRKGKGYHKVINPFTQKSAQPLKTNLWYEIWYVVNNKTLSDGGQNYDVYIRGGEFEQQTKVYTAADFRMQRENPLTYFLANCNTGPKKQPYGNGGVRYDDLYMAIGIHLTTPP